MWSAKTTEMAASSSEVRDGFKVSEGRLAGWFLVGVASVFLGVVFVCSRICCKFGQVLREVPRVGQAMKKKHKEMNE